MRQSLKDMFVGRVDDTLYFETPRSNGDETLVSWSQDDGFSTVYIGNPDQYAAIGDSLYFTDSALLFRVDQDGEIDATANSHIVNFYMDFFP